MDRTIAAQTKKPSRLLLFRKSRKLGFILLLLSMSTVAFILLSSKLLLEIGVHNIVLRYPLAIFFGYGAFFGFIAFWLFLVRRSRRKNEDSQTLDFDVPMPGGSGSGCKEPLFPGGGGRFGGGGASGSFDASAASECAVVPETLATESSAALGEATSVGGNGVSGALDLASAAGEFPPVAIIAVVIVVLTAVFVALGGGFGTVIVGLEATLSEVLLASLLPASLLPRIQGLRQEHWAAILWKSTRYLLGLFIILSVLFSLCVKATNPEAIRFMDIFRAQ